MKKILSTILFAFMAVTMFAQTNPTRMFVRDTAGSLHGFLVERIDSVFFYDVEGQANVDITFHELNQKDPENPKVIVSFKRSEACGSFRFAVLPKAKADALSNAGAVAKYLEETNAMKVSMDYTKAEMTGFDFPFTPGAPYAIIAIAYDTYGVACEMSREDFYVPAADIVGNPSVAYNIDDLQTRQVTVTMTANDDCDGYYVCLYEEGSFEAQYNQWAAMMGFTCHGDMVKAWGANPDTNAPYYGECTHTWKQLNPGKTYDIYIQPTDANGNYGSLIKFQVTLKAQGGAGVSTVDIKIGEFGKSDMGDGTFGYWQKVTYTGNDQTNFHRDIIIAKNAIGSEEFPDEEAVIEYLKTDNPYDPYQNQYGIDYAQWSVDPETDYIAYAIGQNAKGEWGTVAKVEFSTPAASEAAANTVKTAVAPRANAKLNNNVTLPGGYIIKKNITLQ